jgi:hypothetical protein
MTFSCCDTLTWTDERAATQRLMDTKTMPSPAGIIRKNDIRLDDRSLVVGLLENAVFTI